METQKENHKENCPHDNTVTEQLQVDTVCWPIFFTNYCHRGLQNIPKLQQTEEGSTSRGQTIPEIKNHF